MHRTDAPGHNENMFSAGDPANGVQPTQLDADWHNAVQEAICKTIEAADIDLVKGNDLQLRDAIVALANALLEDYWRVDDLTNLSQLINGPGFINTNGRAYPRRSGGDIINFILEGVAGTPTWVWGGPGDNDWRVYSPSNFHVARAVAASIADSLGGYSAADFCRPATLAVEHNGENCSITLPTGHIDKVAVGTYMVADSGVQGIVYDTPFPNASFPPVVGVQSDSPSGNVNGDAYYRLLAYDQFGCTVEHVKANTNHSNDRPIVRVLGF